MWGKDACGGGFSDKPGQVARQEIENLARGGVRERS